MKGQAMVNLTAAFPAQGKLDMAADKDSDDTSQPRYGDARWTNAEQWAVSDAEKLTLDCQLPLL
ncbi:hypothetical protein H109_00297 [Trichophyton interdigitale MR816]|uniref:Uncharacterized protein n=1 Tax=Trichophyton interdigitale (strain MR816) TaxID=1215338 RepID=A0A059JJ74_TRIIM|nr:hypothetical protein H109_00297 [Trichophyton interdigitale MR816]